MLLTLADILSARRRISPYVARLPLLRSAWLSGETGGDVFLALESLQPTGSFKIRGAFNAALRHLAGARASTPIVTASAGNHGRALAYAGERLGFRPVVYAPATAPRAKLDAIRRHGADLRLTSDYDEAEQQAKAHAASGSGDWLSPFSHPDIIAGAGTIGVEIAEELPDVDLVVVPVGGGGLVCGIGIAMRAATSRARVIGVEVEASHPFTAGLAAGHIVPIAVGPSLADGLVGNLDPETITFDLARRLVDRFVLVGEDDLVAGLRALVAHEHLIAEGAGIAAIAAVLVRDVDVRGRRVAVVLSGANIDLDQLRSILS